MSTEAAAILEAPAVADTNAPVETQVTEAPKPQDDKVSGRMEVLIRREQAALQAERRMKAMQADIESKMAKIQEFESAKTEPLKALELLGLTPDDYARTQLNDGEIPAEVRVKKLEEKIDRQNKEREEEKIRAEQDRKLDLQQKEKDATDGFKSEITSYLNDNNARYELILFEEQSDLVFDVIDTHYNRTIDPQTGIGKIMKIADAADKVEQWLEKKEVERKKLSKTQALWGAVPKGTLEKETAKAETPKRQPPQTLTNQMASASTSPKTRPVTDQERVQRAIAYAQNLRK